ncbi:hypothetical protein D3C81_1114500 [compost metagenome]
MRMAKGPLWPAVQRCVTAHRLDGRHLQRFVFVQGWQQPRQAAGEQGLAGARRARKKQVVCPGCRQQQRALGCNLALDFAEVGVGQAVHYQAIGGIGRQRHLAVQVCDQLQQMSHGINHQPACQARFFSVFSRYHQRPTGLPRRQRRWQYTLHRPQSP